MVKCPQNHTVRKQAAKNETKCDGCNAVLANGAEAYRCAKCDFDLCGACFTTKKSQKPAAKGASLVKQGLLKDKKVPSTAGSKSAGSSSAEPSEVFQAFAFSGFPATADAYEIFCLVKEYMHDYLGDFTVEVLGTTVHDGYAHVGVKYKASDAEALDRKVFEMRDYFIYEGSYLNTWVVQNADVFTQPQPPASEMAVDQPPVHDKSAHSFYGTPLGATQRSQGVHSGWTPQLEERHQTLTSFLTGVPGLEALSTLPQAPPLPGSEVVDPTLQALLDGQQALLRGVNELRSSVVTRDSLTQFYQLQRDEMQTFVAAETAPLHSGLARVAGDVELLSKDVVINSEKIGKLETTVRSLSVGAGGRPDRNDVNHCRIAFKGFTTESLDVRYDTVKQFVEKYCGKDAYLCIDTRMMGPYNDRKPTNESFVQFGSRDARDRVMKAIKETSFNTEKGNNIKVYKSKTEWVRGRDWAMGKSEELIKKKLDAAKLSATVKYEKGKEVRKITVNGEDAFVQLATDVHGNFVKNFADLRLP